MGLDALTECGVGEDERWVRHVERPLGADDRKLSSGGVVAEVRHERCTLDLTGGHDVLLLLGVTRSRVALAGRRCTPSSSPVAWGRARKVAWSRTHRRSTPDGASRSRPCPRSPGAGSGEPRGARPSARYRGW